MTTGWNYDHPNYTTRRFQGPFALTAGTGNGNRGFVTPAAGVLHAVYFAATTAGAGATAKRIVRTGTTALGTATLGTMAADGTVVLDLADTAVNAGVSINFVNGTDASSTAEAIVEWSPRGDFAS